ncbi:energy-coupled thiamine transporter ThiT [uncultured Clostridium sp.]|uniref:energy-coupled thiamine transporter ThiT n=1 Tax=uncultured Clostridium sp. TaxID=59620 RepID=UPI00261F0E2D|nr:energy-coupled thiamine transporter ThiT [uncultured Clostridium sp.]
MSLSIGVVGIGLVLAHFFDIRKIKFGSKRIIIIGLFASISLILYIIQFIKYPQGGGITLFSMMPIMILGMIYGRREAITCGVLFGVMKLLNGGMIINPAQFLLDYILPCMALGLSGIFGWDKKWKVFLGCMFVGLLGTLLSTVSGVLYFSQYAPVGMNPWIYSSIYNFSSAGVETLLTSVIMMFVPLKMLKERLGKDEQRRFKQA